jgi:hypothetical protein
MEGFDLNILAEIVRNAISMFFAILQIILVTSFGVVIKLYIDMRSAKKAINAGFRKTRALEAWARRQGYEGPSDDDVNKGARD